MTKVVLIPAGGLGRRVGSPESKEMLPRPIGSTLSGQPMITYALHLSEINEAKAHVILREEKKSLSAYLESLKVPRITQQFVKMTREWPETLLRSKEYWSDLNLVVLPDSDFGPTDVVQKIFAQLQSGAEISFATFSPTNRNLKTWGVIDDRGEKGFFHCEKPNEWTETAKAWGVFGFRKEHGEKLLEQMLESTFDHQWRSMPATKISKVNLEFYRDLTRG